jgi:phenylacetate-CoA ligase
MASLQQLYSRLPVALQHAATSVQGYLYHRTRFAGEYASHLDFLTRTEFASEDELRSLQSARLRKTLQIAAEQVPYYAETFRQHGVEWQGVSGLEDLRALPLTAKSELREQPLSFRREGPKQNLIHWHTSGTTGSPIELVYSMEAVQRLYAFVELYRRQAGILPGERRGQFTGKAIVPGRQGKGKKCFWRFDLANRSMLLSTVHLHPENLAAYAQAIHAYRPTHITGYPSAIAVLAQFYRRAALPAPPLKAVLTTAETLLTHQRELIESTFATRVYDQYGQAEMQSFWYECAHGSLHAHPLAGVTEILLPDGRPAPPGELGEVVLTGLVNDAMPLVRYRVGDLARFAGDGCPCGRSMPVVKEIFGRKEAYIVTRERGFVGRLDPAFKGVRHIVESQVAQLSLDRVKVSVVPTPEFSAQDENRLRHNLRDVLGELVEIAIVKVDRIPRGANGKLQAVISHLPSETALSGAVDVSLAEIQ